MRPALGLENPEPRPRKSSVAEPSPLAGERCTGPPTTFFLARDPDAPISRSETTPATASAALPVSSLQDAMQEAERSGKYSAARPPETRSGSRRRSTIRPAHGERLRRGSSIAHAEPSHARHVRGVTPSPLPSCDISLPSSPKSGSSRSLPRSEDELTSEEAGSQAIGSSEEDEEETPAIVQDSQPELIMPSIKMPSRRPFTQRGKRLGRFKIMVAGRKGESITQIRPRNADCSRCWQNISYQIDCAALRRYSPRRPCAVGTEPCIFPKLIWIPGSGERGLRKHQTISCLVVERRRKPDFEEKEKHG